MISDYRCFFCFVKAFEKLLDKEKLDNESKNCFTRDMATLYQREWNTFSAPIFSRKLHEILKHYTGNPDPYKEAKQENNDLVLKMYPDLKNRVHLSGNPFDTALRLAIAGNIIDFAANSNFDLDSTMDKVLNSAFAIDHSRQLKRAINKANTVLYLGDNAGEIVFDKLFIENIGHPNIFYAVRGAPVINDATVIDAEYVGMGDVAKVISNGYDAPSTILEHCSPEFRDVFYQADVIISKGQGNLEGVLEHTDKDIFYLLMVKCDVIAELLQVKKGDFVVRQTILKNEDSYCQR